MMPAPFRLWTSILGTYGPSEVGARIGRGRRRPQFGLSDDHLKMLSPQQIQSGTHGAGKICACSTEVT
jgi:hypothetical protein